MTWQALFGEKATTKIAVILQTRDQAQELATRLRSSTHVNHDQVFVVTPSDRDFTRKLEPEPQGIARTAIRAHLVCGAAGLVAGLLVWGGLIAADVSAIVSTPGLGGLAIVFVCTVIGLLLGGLITARPDHDALVINQVRKAIDQGQWAVVTHPRSPRECEAIETILNASDVEYLRSV